MPRRKYNPMTIESNPVVSATYVCNPKDSRCRYWAKVIRATDALPLPACIAGASAVPGPYIRKGDDVELFEGDWILEGEENHHRKQRGWTYTLRSLAIRKGDGELAACTFDFGVESRAAIRAAGAKDLLGGSGDVAAMIREIHARRRGIKPMPRTTSFRPAEGS